MVTQNPNTSPTMTSAALQARVIAITSGKGGVGKTNISVNLGIALAQNSKKVCIFDADTGLANINILLGLTPQYTLEHVVNGKHKIKDILMDGPYGIKIVPAASGIDNMVDLNNEQQELLINSLRELEKSFDYLLIDTAAGISSSVLNFVQSAHQTIIVISPDPTSLTDSFSLLRVLKRKGYSRPVKLLVNMASNQHEAMNSSKRFAGAVKKYLGAKVEYLGYVPHDKSVISAVRQQQPVILRHRSSAASRFILTLADRLHVESAAPFQTHFSHYWKQQLLCNPKQSRNDDPTISATEFVDRATPDTLDDLIGKIYRISKNSESKKEMEVFIQNLIDNYINDYSQAPFNPIHAVYRLLQLGDFPESKIKGLIATLESVYDKIYPQPLNDFESQVFKLMAEIHDSQDRYIKLAKLLELSYRKHFRAELFK